MTVVVAVPDSAQGALALEAAVAEAKLLDTNLVAVNLGRGVLDTSAYEGVTVMNLSPTSDQDTKVARPRAMLAASGCVEAGRLPTKNRW